MSKRASTTMPADSLTRRPACVPRDQADVLPTEVMCLCLAFFPLPVAVYLSTLCTSFKQAADVYLRRALRANPSDFASTFFNAHFRIPRLIIGKRLCQLRYDDDAMFASQHNMYHPNTLGYPKHQNTDLHPPAGLIQASKQALIDDLLVVFRAFRGFLLNLHRTRPGELDSDFLLRVGEKFSRRTGERITRCNVYDIMYPRLASNMFLYPAEDSDEFTSTGLFYLIADDVNRFIRTASLTHPRRLDNDNIDMTSTTPIRKVKVRDFANGFLDFLVSHGLTEDLRAQCTITARHTGYLKNGHVYPTPELSRAEDQFETTSYSYAARQEMKQRRFEHLVRQIFGSNFGLEDEDEE
jgi:hypothetical protein